MFGEESSAVSLRFLQLQKEHSHFVAGRAKAGGREIHNSGLALALKGSTLAEEFSRPCCCPGSWKHQKDSVVENPIALFPLLLVASLATL